MNKLNLLKFDAIVNKATLTAKLQSYDIQIAYIKNFIIDYKLNDELVDKLKEEILVLQSLKNRLEKIYDKKIK